MKRLIILKFIPFRIRIYFVYFGLIAGCGGAEFAREKGIPVILFPNTKDEADGLSPADLVATLR